MGLLVLKVNPDPAEDRWCLWSTIAEGPTFDGTEKEMTREYLFEHGERARKGLMRRIERAKTYGAGTDWDGDFDGGAMIMNSEGGSLPRHKLGDLLDIYVRNGTRDEVKALLIPFED